MQKPPWPHAPVHRLSEAGTFMVTAGTYRKQHFFTTVARLDVLLRGLLQVLTNAGWQLEAWAVFSNHYHFIAHSPPSQPANGLSEVLRELHSKTAVWLNRLDQTPNRKVWHNFWESRLTSTPSYLARVNYVHQNAVHHKLVLAGDLYRWCSAAWFERTATPAQVKTIYSFKTDRISVMDSYEPVAIVETARQSDSGGKALPDGQPHST